MRKKSAVEKYSVVKDGKSQEELLSEILSDEKGYTQEEAEEIAKAVFTDESESAIDFEVVYTATQRMRHAGNFDKFHEIGEDVSHYPPETLAHLLIIGAIKKEE